MKVALKDGSIEFATGSIRRDQRRESFLKAPVAAAAKETITNATENWRRISIKPEKGVAASLMFKGEDLHQIYLLMNIPTDDTGEWTAELELQRKAKHDAWLLAELGEPPYRYPWGRIDSEFDPKGCVSEIIVTYAS